MNNIRTASPQSNGGKARAIMQRDVAEAKYLLNPNICLFCDKQIPIEPDKPVSTIKKKKFCNRSCSASLHNHIRPKIIKKIHKCSSCKVVMKQANKMCKKCHDTESCLMLNATSKKELFAYSKNWQCARSSIQRSARVSFNNSNKPKKCEVCGYSKHYEVCHINSVSEFPMTATLAEINHIDNLKALCPNCHWEFDNLKKVAEDRI